jgi:hypothetical protein
MEVWMEKSSNMEEFHGFSGWGDGRYVRSTSRSTSPEVKTCEPFLLLIPDLRRAGDPSPKLGSPWAEAQLRMQKMCLAQQFGIFRPLQRSCEWFSQQGWGSPEFYVSPKNPLGQHPKNHRQNTGNRHCQVL